jgi:hypothetical protein
MAVWLDGSMPGWLIDRLFSWIAEWMDEGMCEILDGWIAG